MIFCLTGRLTMSGLINARFFIITIVLTFNSYIIIIRKIDICNKFRRLCTYGTTQKGGRPCTDRKQILENR